MHQRYSSKATEKRVYSVHVKIESFAYLGAYACKKKKKKK